MTEVASEARILSRPDGIPPGEAEKASDTIRLDTATLLMQVVRRVSLAPSAAECLQSLFDTLRTERGMTAMALELMAGQVTRFRLFGDTTAFGPYEPGDPQAPACYTCALHDHAAPPGSLIYVFPRGTVIEADLLEAASAQAAMRIGQENLIRRAEEAEEKAGQRISEVGAIYEIGQAIDQRPIDQIELPQLLKLITERAARLMSAQACSLMLVHPETGVLRVEASYGLSDEAMQQERQIGEGFAGRVAQTGEPLLIVGHAQDPRLDGLELRPDIGSSILVPLKREEGRALGVLSIRRRPAIGAHAPIADFSQDDLKLFSVFATQAAQAVTNVRLYADLRLRAAELDKLSTLSRALISTIDLDHLLERVADDVCNVVGFARCCLYIRDPSRALYLPRVRRGYPESVAGNLVREGEGAVGAVARRKMALVFDVRAPATAARRRERHYLQLKGFARSLGVDSFVAVPIVTRQDDCLGVVVVDNKGRRDPISDEQKSLLIAFVNQAGIAIDNALLYAETQDSLEINERLRNYTDNVLNSVSVGILSTDSRGSIARCNRAARRLLRQPASLFQDALLLDVLPRLCLPEEEVAYLISLTEHVLETGEPLHFHKLTLHPHGQDSMTINLNLSRLTEAGQEKGGVVIIFEDVTQEVRLEAELDQMRRLADIGQFAARTAHEVRNALASIKGAAQMVRGELEEQNAPTEWPEVILSEVDSLTLLTGEILDFARSGELTPQQIAVNEFLWTAVNLLGSVLTEHRVQVVWQLADNLPEISADPVRLGQVVRNLVINAVQAMPEGGVLTIRSEYDPRTELVVIHLQDTGNGIPEDVQGRIFQPFMTTKTKGTGLGLPIVQKIVSQHGGRITFESRRGQGTLFSVSLPISPMRDPSSPFKELPPFISNRHDGPLPDS